MRRYKHRCMDRLPSRLLLPALRVLCCASAFVVSCCAAQIYGSVGIDGSVVLSNFRTEPTQVIVVDDGRSGGLLAAQLLHGKTCPSCGPIAA